MKCSACRAQLGAFQDGTLRSEAAARLQAHLDSCVGCRTFAEEMMVVEHRLARVAQIAPRTDFTQLVMASIRMAPAPAPRRSRIVWLGVYDLLAWALLVALAATGILHWKALAADGALALGKLAVGAGALYRVADHFHLTSIALIGGVAEGCALLFLLYAGRHYLARVRMAFFGAQTI